MSRTRVLVLSGHNAPASLPVGEGLELGPLAEPGHGSPAIAIRADGAGWRLVRLDPSVPVQVNGRPAEASPLTRGDLIQCGESVLLFDRPEEDGPDKTSTIHYRAGDGESADSSDPIGALDAIARVLRGVDDEDELVRRLGRRLERAIRADRVEIPSDDEDGLGFLPAAQARAIASEGRLVLLEREGGWIAAVPVESRRRRLLAAERKAGPFGPDDLLLLAAAARLLAAALDRGADRSSRSATVAELERAASALAHVQRLGSALVHERDWDRLLDRVLDAALELSGAERAFLLFGRGEEEERVLGRTFDGERIDNATAKISRSVVERTISTERRLVVADAAVETPYAEIESIQDRQLRSIVCLPLVDGPRILGCLYLDHRHHPDVFGGPRLSVLSSLADLASAALSSARLLAEVRRLNRRLESDNERLARSLTEARAWSPGGGARHRLVGNSPKLAELRDMIARAADSDLPVLVGGESGTGKELVARALHAAGRRGSGPFVSENAAALTGTLLEAELFGHEKGAFTGADETRPGLFEAASGGVLFLDEVADLSPAAQAKLLRVLEEKVVRRVGGTVEIPVDVRIVTASHQDIEALVAAGRFREDLFYRLSVIRLSMPGLRDRPEDIAPLAEHILREVALREGTAEKRLSPEALADLSTRPWEGNVRELKNVLEAAALMAEGEVIAAGDLPRPVSRRGRPSFEVPFAEYKDRVLSDYFDRLLATTEGNITQAAKTAGISRQNLQRYLREFGLR